MKKILFSILIILAIKSFAMDCNEAKLNLMNTTTDIRSNHQSYDSFNLEGQTELLKKDDEVLSKYDYIKSLNFYNKNCSKLN